MTQQTSPDLPDFHQVANLQLLEWHLACHAEIAVQNSPRNWYETVQKPLEHIIGITRPRMAHPQKNLTRENLAREMPRPAPEPAPIPARIAPQNTAKQSLEGSLTIIEAAKKAVGNISDWDGLIQGIKNFSCPLKETATHTITHRGNPQSEIMLITDMPYTEEEQQQKSFAGRYGQLLETMLNMIGLEDDNHYLMTQLIYWRPPGERSPTESEVEICRPFFEKMIALAAPKIIVALGSKPCQYLLAHSTETVDPLRLTRHNYQNPFMVKPCSVIAGFHPCADFQNPAQEKGGMARHALSQTNFTTGTPINALYFYPRQQQAAQFHRCDVAWFG